MIGDLTQIRSRSVAEDTVAAAVAELAALGKTMLYTKACYIRQDDWTQTEAEMTTYYFPEHCPHPTYHGPTRHLSTSLQQMNLKRWDIVDQT